MRAFAIVAFMGLVASVLAYGGNWVAFAVILSNLVYFFGPFTWRWISLWYRARQHWPIDSTDCPPGCELCRFKYRHSQCHYGCSRCAEGLAPKPLPKAKALK